MTARRGDRTPSTLHVEVGRRTAYLHGARIVPALNRLGIPKQWDPARRCWSVPVDRADDLIAYCEHNQRRAVTVEAAPR